VSAAGIVLLVGGILVALVVGSFTNVIVDRLPVELDEPNEFGELYGVRPWAEVVGGRSRCSSCGEPVRPSDNIPVVSWLLLRGRCRDCGASIPAFHLVGELAVPVLVGLAVALVGINPQLPMALWLIPFGVAVTIIDHRTLIVPTRLVWPAFGVSVVIAVVTALVEGRADWLAGAATGVLVLAGPLFTIWFIHPRGMGFGDVRLAVVLGWHIGFAAVAAGAGIRATIFLTVASLAFAALSGLVYAIFALRSGRRVPFGPTLVAGALIAVLLAERIVDPLA